MKTLIFSALFLPAVFLNTGLQGDDKPKDKPNAQRKPLQVITKIGRAEGTVQNNQVHVNCMTSTVTCWEYDTETRVMTIYWPDMVVSYADCSEPIETGPDSWEATIEQ